MTRSVARAMASAEDLLAPPRASVALLGFPDLHPAVGECLRARANLEPKSFVGADLAAEATRALPPAPPAPAPAAPPAPAPAADPLGAVAAAVVPAATAAAADGAGGESDRRDPPPPPPLDEILPAVWLGDVLARPSVACALVPHESAEGDPSSWAALSSTLDALRAAASGANARLVVVVAGEHAPETLSEDRASAARRRAGIDAPFLVTLPLPPTPDALARLAAACARANEERCAAEERSAVTEAAAAGASTSTSDDASRTAVFARYRAATFAELRGDVPGALAHYASAHDALLVSHVAAEKSGEEHERSSAAPARDRARRAAVAELLSRKATSLALRQPTGGSARDDDANARGADMMCDDPHAAIARFTRHVRAFERAPAWRDPSSVSANNVANNAYVAAQFETFADALASRVPWGLAGGEPPRGAPREWCPGFYYHAAARAAERARAAAMEGGSGGSNGGGGGLTAATHLGAFVDAATGARLGDEAYLSRLDAAAAAREDETSLGSAAKIVDLLGKAKRHYATFYLDQKRERFFAGLASQLARAHFQNGDVAAAKTELEACVSSFRRERWDDLLAPCLTLSKDIARGAGAAAGADAELAAICLELAALDEDAGPRGVVDGDAAMAAASAAMASLDASARTLEIAPGSGLERAFRVVAGFRFPASAAAENAAATSGEAVEFAVALRSSLPSPLAIDRVDIECVDPTYGSIASVDAIDALPSRAWRVASFRVVPTRGKPVAVAAVSATLKNGVVLRRALGLGREGANRAEATERLPSAMSSVSTRVGVYALDVRDAPAKVRFANDDDERAEGDEREREKKIKKKPPTKALLGETTRTPLTIASDGDALRDCTLSVAIVASSGLGSGDGDVTIDDDDGVVEMTVDGVALKPGAIASVGDVDANATRAMTLATRWRRVLPTTPFITARVTLRGKRCGEYDGADAVIRASATFELASALSTTAATTGGYRRHALRPASGSAGAGDDVEVEGSRTGVTVRVADADGAAIAIAAADGAAPGEGDALRRGDAYALATSSDADVVDVKWRRFGFGGRDASDSPHISEEISSRLALPPRNTQRRPSRAPPPLTVELRAPPRVAVGEPFDWRLRCDVASDIPQALCVEIVDASGFVFAGARRATYVVPPGASLDVSHALVAVTSGEALLPEVTVTAPRLGAKCAPPRESRAVYVLPHAREVGGGV